MRRAILVTVAAFSFAAYGIEAVAEGECEFILPGWSSPLNVYDGAVYAGRGTGFYSLIFPPTSGLVYAAVTTEDEIDTPCALSWVYGSQYPYVFWTYQYPVNPTFTLWIMTDAWQWTRYLPWPCEQVGSCISFGGSTVAAYNGDIDDPEVNFYVARYLFLTILWR